MSDILGLAAIFEKKAKQKFTIHPSPIHGNGTFAVQTLSSGDDIGLALRETGDSTYSRTLLGRYVNHADDGNIALEKTPEGYHFVATREIQPEEEMLTNYREYEELMHRDHTDNFMVI